jgi:serine phosphatase RsbU (regulator of sigma subunit)
VRVPAGLRHVPAGDVLVGYTDGISEAMNAADEEWGEERLMTSADRFVSGAPQHDDMTLIVVRADSADDQRSSVHEGTSRA